MSVIKSEKKTKSTSSKNPELEWDKVLTCWKLLNKGDPAIENKSVKETSDDIFRFFNNAAVFLDRSKNGRGDVQKVT